jgi:hypothetical protein
VQPADVVTLEERTPTYFALRLRPRAERSPWWGAALRSASTAPPSVRAILGGRSRVEVGAAEAVAALAWSRAIPGWEADGLAPLWVYPLEP